MILKHEKTKEALHLLWYMLFWLQFGVFNNIKPHPLSMWKWTKQKITKVYNNSWLKGGMKTTPLV
jgi:hypothetical protein